MRYLAVASDYDGTLALDGEVDTPTVAALERLRASGRRLILVSGRELEDLLRVFPHINLCDLVVVENGALLYRPASREEQPFGDPPPEAFVHALRERNVDPLSVGRVIVATWHPNETTVLEVIRELGLELQVIFNKGAVMVLPPGVNKATGLRAALIELGLSSHNVVAVGDAENDQALFGASECAVAVSNALPMIKERVDWVTNGDHGAGVAELIDQLIASDLDELAPRLQRHNILLGTRAEGQEVTLPPYGTNVLLAGTSGSGKSTVAAGMLERLAERRYQFCIIDPEGDYETFAEQTTGTVMLGASDRAPDMTEVLELLKEPIQNVVINLLGIALQDRPAFFESLLSHLLELRARTGRPHWIVVDEAHHLLPASWDPVTPTLPPKLSGLLLITVHPNHVAPAILSTTDTIIAVGEAPEQTLQAFAGALGQQPPKFAVQPLKAGEAIVWSPPVADEPFHIRIAPPKTERQRHRRKYAQGELGPDRSFYFRGPEGKLNLRAQNLLLFVQLADGVDDATWLHHLKQGDYSRWFREAIKDEELAAEIAQIEQASAGSPEESRARIKAAIMDRYTLPA